VAKNRAAILSPRSNGVWTWRSAQVLPLSAQVLPLRAEVLDIKTDVSSLGARVNPLQAALKDLGATVRGKEIKIDLSADVLFNFDKADLRREAGRHERQHLTFGA
jgi:outer membrane protein OmpA-like peptidoglycan-associated protein